MSRIMGEWEVHVALLGVTVYALLRIREKRRIDDLLASYGPDVKLPPHLISYVPYLVRVLYCCDNLVTTQKCACNVFADLMILFFSNIICSTGICN